MDFQLQLEKAIEEWNSGDVDDEWLFQTLREDHVGRMTSEEAFSEIKHCVTKLRNQENENTATEVVETLIALAMQSKTTEIPENLLSAKASLVGEFSSYDEYARGKLGELFKHYGINI